MHGKPAASVDTIPAGHTFAQSPQRVQREVNPVSGSAHGGRSGCGSVLLRPRRKDRRERGVAFMRGTIPAPGREAIDIHQRFRPALLRRRKVRVW